MEEEGIEFVYNTQQVSVDSSGNQLRLNCVRTEPGEPAPPDGILRNGDCVEIELDNDAREVACTGDLSVDRGVRAVIPFDDTCPGLLRPHRDRLGMGVACVEFPAPS